jgi:hypothetical protein
MALLIDANQFEDEIREAADITEDDEAHSRNVLAAGPICCHEKYENGDGNCGNSKVELCTGDVCDNDEELHREAEEEEEIELQKCNENL